MNQSCNICGQSAEPFGQALVLNRHRVRYFRCSHCGFVQTEEPFWLPEAYSEALSGLDVGAVSRNLRLAPVAQRVIGQWFNTAGSFIDYGAGSGLFVRLMRDVGLDFYWLDKFAGNVFAQGFEAAPGSYELLTAFEVFEHLARPVDELEQMFSLSHNVLSTTVLLPDPVPDPGTWWYYGLEHGQHVSFYTRQALQVLADRFHLRLCSCGEIHLLTERPIRDAQFGRVIRSRWAAWKQARAYRGRSLTTSDYELLAQRRSEAS
jgi:hypothetical protein